MKIKKSKLKEIIYEEINRSYIDDIIYQILLESLTADQRNELLKRWMDTSLTDEERKDLRIELVKSWQDTSLTDKERDEIRSLLFGFKTADPEMYEKWKIGSPTKEQRGEMIKRWADVQAAAVEKLATKKARDAMHPKVLRPAPFASREAFNNALIELAESELEEKLSVMWKKGIQKGDLDDLAKILDEIKKEKFDNKFKEAYEKYAAMPKYKEDSEGVLEYFYNILKLAYDRYRENKAIQEELEEKKQPSEKSLKKIEKSLRKTVKKKFPKDKKRQNKYIYGTKRKTGWKPKKEK